MRLALAATLCASCVGFVDEPEVTGDHSELPVRIDEADAGGSTGATDASTDPLSDAGVADAGTVLVDAGAVDAGRPADSGIPFDAGVIDAGLPTHVDAGMMDVLVAQGRFGRTTISCDDGASWHFDHDEANGRTCSDVDCFHSQWSSMGLVHTGMGFVTTWGWGAIPGKIQRTTNGVTWNDVLPNTAFGALTAGGGTVVAASNPPRVSTSDGVSGSWNQGGQLMAGNVTRHAAYLSGGSGRFLIALDDTVKASDDRGTTWFTLPVPTTCFAPMLGILASDSTVVLVRYDGRVCTSTDRGMTWASRTVDAAFSTRGVYAQGAFHVWNNATRHRSVDGLTWTSANGSPGSAQIGAVAVTRSGTFVAFKGGWRSDYENERVYRSADGVAWQEIPPANSARSHAITALVSGPLDGAQVPAACRR